MKANCIKLLISYWPRDMLSFDFLEKNRRIESQPHFMYNFLGEMSVMLFPINWSNVIVWLPLLLEILGNMWIAIVCFPGCKDINFEINFIFLTKKSRQKCKYFEDEKDF